MAQESSYTAITGPCHLSFPRDHGPHPGTHTEWWYYTGNLRSETGDQYGFQLTFFRSRLSPPGAEKEWPDPPSAWRAQQLYLAHAALSDIGRKRFTHAEAMARGALGLAGAEQDSSGLTRVYLKDWSARIGAREQVLAAHGDDFSLNLTLEALKEPVLHGDSGYSLKGSTPERSSCYYSFTRLEGGGTIAIGGKTLQVQGTAWMDHEFSSAPLEPDLVGWDWFSLQLNDGSELMIYLLRRGDGTYTPASSGTYVDRNGSSTSLGPDAFSVEILDHWKSPHTRALYPARWKVRVPSRKIDLTVTPKLNDQELQTQETTRVTYWEGCVSASGTAGGGPVQADGYVELTGYDKPLNAPL